MTPARLKVRGIEEQDNAGLQEIDATTRLDAVTTDGSLSSFVEESRKYMMGCLSKVVIVGPKSVLQSTRVCLFIDLVHFGNK